MSRSRCFILVMGFLFLLLAVSLGVLGYVDKYKGPYFASGISNFLGDYSVNCSTSLFVIAITVLVIDVIYGWRNQEREKRDLVLQLGSNDNAFAKEAARKLKARKWLANGTLRNAYLRGADLSGADLENANMRGADLYGAELEDATLKQANLRNADLRLVNFRDAGLRDADLRGANLTEADFRDANLKGAKVTKEQLEVAESCQGATLPDDLE